MFRNVLVTHIGPRIHRAGPGVLAASASASHGMHKIPHRGILSARRQEKLEERERAEPPAQAEPSVASSTWMRCGVPSFLHGKLQLMKAMAPTNVQKEALPYLCSQPENPPDDCVIHSETGSGKTLAYLLPILSRIEPKVAPHAKTRAIIVTPTRELSHQVARVAAQLGDVGKHKDPAKAVRVQRVVGEVTADVMHSLKHAPPHILVGTPHTLASLIPQHVNLGELQCLVLDEADELLRNHSIGSVKSIVQSVRRLKMSPGIVAVSATSSFGLQKFITEHMRRSVKVFDLMGGSMGTPETLNHLFIRVPTPAAAYNTFTRALAALRPMAALSFHNSAKTMEAMEAHLRAKNVRVRVIGSAYANAQRAKALDSISTGAATVLLSTEMAARGLDLPRLSHVFCFDPAKSLREYVHRVGRVARLSSKTAGRQGTAVTFCLDDKEVEETLEMCKELGVSLSELTITEGEPEVTPLLGAVPNLDSWRRAAPVRAKAKDKAAAAASDITASPLDQPAFMSNGGQQKEEQQTVSST